MEKGGFYDMKKKHAIRDKENQDMLPCTFSPKVND
jgi:hypothetical protein